MVHIHLPLRSQVYLPRATEPGRRCAGLKANCGRSFRRVLSRTRFGYDEASELVGEPELEIVLHQTQLIGNGQGTVRGRTTVASSRVREAEGAGIERYISEIGVAILPTRHPIGPEPQFGTDAGSPAKLGRRVRDDGRSERSSEVVVRGAVCDGDR